MSNSAPLVSVIVPNYNHHLYLPERIGSILSQEFQDFELILLDDCSPDNSVEIFERYRSNPKVSHICVNEQNSGSTFKQWEKGISLSRGKYIWIAESDDSSDPRLLGSIVNALERYPSAVVGFCTTMEIDSEGNSLKLSMDDYPQKFCTLHEGMEFIKRKMLYLNSIVNASAVVFKKELWEKVDKEFTSYRLCGDWLFWLEVLRQGNVVWIHRSYNYFRKHPGEVTPRAFKEGVNFREMKGVLSYMERNLSLNWYVLCLLRGYVLVNILRSKVLSNSLREELIKWWRKEYPASPLYAIVMSISLFVRNVLIRLGMRKQKYKKVKILNEF